MTVLATASLCFSNLHPVRCLITSPGEAICLNKAFHQPWTVTVLEFEILSDAAQYHPQNACGQIVAVDHRADKKATHTNHTVQVLPARRRVPIDPLIPILKLQRCSAESKAAQPTIPGTNQITHLRTHQRPGTLRVFT